MVRWAMLAALAVSACADGGSPASAACPGITARCGGICVDLSTDRDHCGECGHACTELGKGCFAGQCTSPAPMGRPRALHAVAVASDGRMYAIGGHDDTFAPTTRVEAYDPATNRWSEVKPMTVPRTVLSAVAQGDRVLAIVLPYSGIAAGSLGFHDGQNFAVGVVEAIVGDPLFQLTVVSVDRNFKPHLRPVGQIPSGFFKIGIDQGITGFSFGNGFRQNTNPKEKGL